MEDLSGLVLNNVKQGGLYLWELVVIQFIIAVELTRRIFRFFVPAPQKSLRGEIILVTGTGNGIGRQIALNLGGLGAKIICWDIETEANSKLVNELSTSGTKAFGYTVDLSNMEAIIQTSAKVRKEVGDVTMIINNAGIVPNGSFLKLSAKLEEKMMKVNVLSHFQILREWLPRMIEQNHGHIVTIASMASFFPARELAGYTACKHANYGFIESVKQELDDHPHDTTNIHFTTVYPTFVRTRLMDGVTLSPMFPSNFPIVTPEFVGKETVKAMRRNVEHLFIPKRASLVPLLRALVPTEAKKRLQKAIFKCDVARDESRDNNNFL